MQVGQMIHRVMDEYLHLCGGREKFAGKLYWDTETQLGRSLEMGRCRRSFCLLVRSDFPILIPARPLKAESHTALEGFCLLAVATSSFILRPPATAKALFRLACSLCRGGDRGPLLVTSLER